MKDIRDYTHLRFLRNNITNSTDPSKVVHAVCFELGLVRKQDDYLMVFLNSIAGLEKRDMLLRIEQELGIVK